MGPDFKANTTINTSPIGSDKMSHGPFSMTETKDGYYQGRYVTYNQTDSKNYCWTDSDYFSDEEVG